MLREDTIYLGDNGRAFCGTLKCAGTSSYYTGHDLSGQEVMPLTEPADIRYALAHGIKCEHCGKRPSLIQVVRA